MEEPDTGDPFNVIAKLLETVDCGEKPCDTA